MRKIFGYYEIPATLRLDKQQAKPWPEWPHVALANVPNGAAAWKAFQETYLSPLDCLWHPKEAADLRAVLRHEWERVAGGEVIRGAPTPDSLDIRVAITPEGEVEMVAASLRDFIMAAFWRDAALARTRICPSPECPSRYFLETKRGQIYCSHRCAVRENVRRFRQQETKERTTKKGKK